MERWSPIYGFEDRYEASDEGRVRSTGMFVDFKDGRRHFRKGRVLRQSTKANGYLQVTLVAATGERYSKLVHQLVCLAFKGRPPYPDSQVCHWDGDRANNKADNLRYGDAAENAADRRRHGNFVCNLPGLEWCSS